MTIYNRPDSRKLDCATLGDWCNGSTADSESVSIGSNPISPVFISSALAPVSNRRPLKDDATSIHAREIGLDGYIGSKLLHALDGFGQVFVLFRGYGDR